MPVKTFRPLTPSTRYVTIADFSDITKTRPEKRLVRTRKKTGGRNCYGRATARGIGGGHKQKIRLVDFRRNKFGVEATVSAIEYDPMRSAPPEIGNCLPLKSIPLASAIHNIEIMPGRGGQMVRSAGGAATLMSRDEGYAQVRLPSGEIRRIHETCYATVGQVGNLQHENVILGKAGRSRHRGIRPINRGGAGKSKSGGGWQQLTSPWGLLAKGYRTRDKRKLSSRFIVVRRDGRPMKQK